MSTIKRKCLLYDLCSHNNKSWCTDFDELNRCNVVCTVITKAEELIKEIFEFGLMRR